MVAARYVGTGFYFWGAGKTFVIGKERSDGYGSRFQWLGGGGGGSGSCCLSGSGSSTTIEIPLFRVILIFFMVFYLQKHD